MLQDDDANARHPKPGPDNTYKVHIRANGAGYAVVTVAVRRSGERAPRPRE